MRCEIFTDPFYNGDTHIEFDPDEVVEVQEKTVRLFLRGKHRVTVIGLRGGARYILRGEMAARIEVEQNQIKAAANAKRP
jgi:hypothetical protein